MEEMLPVRDMYLEQLYTFGGVGRDPRGRVVSVAYLAVVPAGGIGELLTRNRTLLRPFRVETGAQPPVLTGEDGCVLTGGDLAFDHGRIIGVGVQRLQGKIDYTDIAFHFLNDPGAFSLGELQAVFEAVLEKLFKGEVLLKIEQLSKFKIISSFIIYVLSVYIFKWLLFNIFYLFL
jgi:8-oxo-dGTP diphosphatase